MTFYILMALMGCWPLVAKAAFWRTYSWGETGIQLAAMVIVVFAGWQLGVYSQATRTEIWNGEITGKERVRVKCSHDYKCRCKMVTEVVDGKKRKVEQCDTCYEHKADYDWDVYSNVGGFEIPRIDRQGIYPPPRWTQVQAGQPAAREHSYQNYVAARELSLFHKKAQELAHLPDVPKYPRVFDYHYANRVLPVKVTLPDAALWQQDLAELLKELGPAKQANVTLVIAGTPDPNFRHKVEGVWAGANKNDVIVLVGVEPEGLKILWADVITFANNTGNEALAVNLRNALVDLGTIDRTNVLAAVGDHVRREYTRPQMKDFEYLKSQIEPSTFFQWFFSILLVGINIGVTFIFHRNDWKPQAA